MQNNDKVIADVRAALELLTEEQTNTLLTLGMCDKCTVSTDVVPIFSPSENKHILKRFCANCMKEHLKNHRNDSELNLNLTPGCDNKLGSTLVPFLRSTQQLQEETLSSLDKIHISALRREFKYCVSCDVIGTPKVDGDFKYTCSNSCGRMWCGACGEWHKKEAPC